jgi:hypothetical protein
MARILRKPRAGEKTRVHRRAWAFMPAIDASFDRCDVVEVADVRRAVLLIEAAKKRLVEKRTRFAKWPCAENEEAAIPGGFSGTS